MLLVGLDLSIVSTAIPKIAHEFNALPSAAWIATAYMVTITALQPMYGRLSDIFGRVASLIGAIILFIAGSAASGWASSMGLLIFGRALQGVGGAGIEALVFIIVSDITTEKERPAYLGVIGAVWSISSIVGPILGGVFSDHVSWRWAFLINLPIGGVLLIGIVLLLRMPRPAGTLVEKLKKVDFLGSLVLVSGVTMILLALNWGGKSYAWSSARIICLLVFGVVLLGLFVVVELKVAVLPSVPIKLFRIRNVGLVVAGQLFMGAAMYTPIYFVPIWYAAVKNASNTAGTAMLVVGLGLMILLDEQTKSAAQIGFMLLTGVGVGISIQLLLILAQKASPAEEMASTTTLYLFMRVLGYSMGVSILECVMLNSLSPKLDYLAARNPDYSRQILDAMDDQTKIYSQAFPDALRAELVHAFVLALRNVFIAAVPFAAVAFMSALALDYTRSKKPAAVASKELEAQSV
ncbi:hypothetical protein EV174_000809 [Coemansia sp. RSA 2320]|nr:hypothetical protein EV174_000809 [Coemansia sp. RSA 2320]